MQSFIGFDDNAILYNRSYTITESMPGLTSRKAAFVSPIWPTIGGNFLEEVAGGVFSADGQFVEAASQPRSDGRNAMKNGQSITLPAAIAKHIPKAVFGGIAFDHFGHFLLEASARLWCLEPYKHLPWLFLTDGRTELKRYQRDFLVVLGLSPEQIIPISEWYSVDELIIPEPAFIYHHHVTHAYRDIFRNAPLQPKAGPGRKIFLSRTNTTIATTIGEQELETMLRHDGWDIVYPEHQSAADQASLFRDDNVILGLQGSALHLGLFAPPGRRVVHLCRGLGYRGYYILDDLMQADATYFNAMRSHELPSKPISGPFLLDLDATIAFLRAESLITTGAAVPVGVPEEMRRGLENEYAAWWHYTESQIRFHHQIDHEGASIPQIAALDSAITAVKLNSKNSLILCHALALLLKFKGAEAAGALLDQYAAPDFLASAQGNALLFYYVSLIRDERGDHAAALDAAAQAFAQAPDNATFAHQCAALHFRLGNLDDAEAVSRQTVAAGIGIASNYYLLSLVAQARGDVEATIEWARQALKTDRYDTMVFRHLIGLLKTHDRADEALATYRSFLERGQTSAQILIELADLESAAGESEAASQHRLQAYAITPEDPAIAGLCLEMLTQAGQLPELAGLNITPLPAIQDQSIMIYLRSVSLAEQGALEQALQLAILAVELFPDNDTIMGHLFATLLKTSRWLHAHLLINHLLAMGCVSATLFYVLSLVEGEFGQTEKARHAAARAAALAPDNDEIMLHYQRFLELA